MNKKRIWLALPAVLLPYVSLYVWATIFLSTSVPFFEMTMETVFGGNGLYLVAVFFLYCLLAAVLGIVCLTVSISKKWDALSLAKFAMIVKLMQIPAYLVMFVLGFLFMLTVFTLPLAVAFFLVCCLTLALTGLWVISAAVNAIRQGVCEMYDVVWPIVFQFVFCADVVAAIVFYIKLKKKEK